MSAVCNTLIAFLSLMLFFSLELSADPIKHPDAKQESSNNNHKTHDDEVIAAPIFDATGRGILRQLEAISTNLKPDHEKEKRQESNEQAALEIGRSDLIQQERMAKYTFWICIATAIQTLIGAIGIYFLIQTLKETRRATTAAINAVKQNRAWIGHVSNQVNNPVNLTNGNHVEVTWINEGFTYALNVSIESP